MPLRMGASRNNATDIKIVVDALEMALDREYISTFVICTGDSDFSPLVHKLRELNKRVIGVGVESSTSRLLPPACDEFLFYERLEGVESGDEPRRRGRRGRRPADGEQVEVAGAEETADERESADTDLTPPPGATAEPLEVRVAQTLAGLAATADAVTASVLKRALLRKDPTFSESDHGFRSFGEVLRHLAERNVVELSEGPAAGDPQVTLPERGEREDTFALLVEIVREAGGTVPLSGLKDRVRKHRPEFSEKSLGYRSFLQFCKAAQTDGHIRLDWDEEADGYLVTA